MFHAEKAKELLPMMSARAVYNKAKKLECNGNKTPSLKIMSHQKRTMTSKKTKSVNVGSKNGLKSKIKKEVIEKKNSGHILKTPKCKDLPIIFNDEIASSNKNKKKSKKRKLGDCPPALVNLKCLKTDGQFENGTKSINAREVNAQSRDSYELGAAKFNHLISPIPNEKFFKQYWEKKVLHIHRKDENYYKGLFSTKAFNNILNTRNVQFTKNLDLATYKDGKRETHNPEGRALAPVVWDHFNDGCSVRFLNPQTFHKPVWNLLATLQEYFHSFCGANTYLTPPGTQGFAPHWDDIEAFVLQLEGKKRWRVYSPRTEKETLPRESSGNFGPDNDLGSPVLDVILEPGDLLYFPRGFIHQGEALEAVHSLHITFSTYQKTSWVDFLEKLIPASLATAAEEDIEFRKGLPLGYGNAGGVALAEVKSIFKEQFSKKVTELVGKLMNYAPIDAAIDQMMKGFIHDSLPPVITEDEKECSAYGGGERWNDHLKKVLNVVEMAPDTMIRLLRKGCIRLVLEENSVRLFHSVDNNREYHAEEVKYVELGSEMGPGVETLIQSYPKYVKVEDLPLESLADKLTLAMGLWEKGLVTTDEPLVNDLYDD